MSKPREFCAILVGGSVAGLTMAHMLSQAKINYILLEARDTLSPQLGAGIVLMPNGSRILDQLGLLDEMRGFLTRMAVQHRRKSDGTLVNRQDWPTLVEERYVSSFFLTFGFLCFVVVLFLDEKGMRCVLWGAELIVINEDWDTRWELRRERCF